jgi:hypothetical protein
LRCYPYPEGTSHPIPIPEKATPEERKEFEVFNAGRDRLRAEEETSTWKIANPNRTVTTEVFQANNGRRVNVGGKAYIAFDVRNPGTGRDYGRCETVLYQPCEVVSDREVQNRELRAVLWFVPAGTGYEGATAEVPVVMG